MAYKILENVLSATVSEARNAPATAATIVIAGANDILHGDTVVLTHDQAGKRALYPLQAVKVEYANGKTTITARSLLTQLFNCILPEMPDQVGEASVIVKAVLAALNTALFADVYVNDDNFVATGTTYGLVNVSHRKVGELLQDICKDTQFVMWIGYDEINDKMNAFFFKPVSVITQDLGAVKEGVNIVSETVQKGSVDDITNYVLMYYFPKRYPYGEDWTEPPLIAPGTAARTWYADYAAQARIPGAAREVRLFQAGPVTHLSSDCVNENHLHVSDTNGFAATGLLLIDGYALVYYTSKTATTFVLSGAISGKWTAGAIICQGWMSDGDYDPTCEATSVMMAPVTETVDQLDFYVESIHGNPGNIKVYVVSSEYGQPLQEIGTIAPNVGWNTLSFDPAVVFGAGTFYTFRVVFIVETPATVDNYYTLGMGPSAAGDFWYWEAAGSDVYGSVGDPLQMLSFGMFSGLMTAPNTTWVCTGATKAFDQQAFLSAGGTVMNDNRAGKGCIRFIGAGTAKVEDAADISQYDRLHFFSKGHISQVEIICQGGSYLQALDATNSSWSETEVTLATMLTTGTPTDTLISIKFTNTGGSAWVDGLYFLAPTSGLPVTWQDDASVLLYGQHPEVIYATGVTESSYAYSLAQAIVADKKVPKYAGSIVVKDVPARWTPQKSVRVIIPSKDIDEVMDIFQVTHTMDGLATLEVNSFEFDYARVLAGLQSGVENLQISFGASPRADENISQQVTAKPQDLTKYLFKTGGTMTGALITANHGLATLPEAICVVYGTVGPPSAATTPIGTLFVKYEA